MNAEKTVKNWKASFATIYAGQAFSIIGSAAVQFAIIWWITYQTESAISLTLATIASFLPNIFIGPFAGVWVDRYNRRTVMMLADGFVGLSSVVLMFVFIANSSPPLWVLYAVLFARGLGNTFHQPAMQAAIPMLVPKNQLVKAGGWGNLVFSGANMLGPVFGAALMAGTIPIQYIMIIDIAGAAFAIICLCFVKIPNIEQTGERKHVLSDMRIGIATARKNRPIMRAFFPIIAINLAFMPLGSLFPLLVRTHFNGTAWHSGLSELAFGGGMVIASLVMGIFGGKRRRFLLTTIALSCMGFFAMWGGFLPPSAFVVFLIGCAFMGATGPLFNIPVMAFVQETIPQEHMGKVFSFFSTAMSLAMPFGLLIAGPVSEQIGTAQWFLFSGIIIMVIAAWFWFATHRYDNPDYLAAALITGQDAEKEPVV